ncbi:MAG TPA: hypothetical protein PKC23_10070 [Candidatus Desulfobacillus sp.]|nr:hypothetical protein [Candidatus Desulfobacillus sp.]
MDDWLNVQDCTIAGASALERGPVDLLERQIGGCGKISPKTEKSEPQSQSVQ